jgi:hypothetical protein
VKTAVRNLILMAPPFTPSRLFRAGEQGAWYDPSDFSSMYQDSAGTTPVTAVEQPVGKILDKSGRGNHAIQATAASRPTLSARVNLLTKTEDFSDGTAWLKQTGGVASAPVVVAQNLDAPDGTLTASRVTFTINGGTLAADLSQLASATQTPPAVSYRNDVWLRTSDGSTKAFTFLKVDGSATTISVTGTWQKFSNTVTASGGAVNPFRLRLRGGEGTADSATIDIWHPDIRPTADTLLSIPAYQRVNTASDYDTAGFPYYLRFDGVDDSLSTGTVDFTATDKMTVWAGVHKASDVNGVVAELSAASTTNAGAFALFMPSAALNDIYWRNAGTVIANASAVYAAPTSKVVTGIGDIAGDIDTLRVNGVVAAATTTDQGTGNYGNHVFYIGRRGGSSLPFNGRIYSLIVRGAATTASQIAQAERYIARRMGVSL